MVSRLNSVISQCLAAAAVLASTALGQNYSATEIYSGSVAWENAVLRPNGQLLLISLGEPYVYNLDPSAAVPTAVVIATLPDVDSAQGIASIGDDVYAVSGGVTGANSAYSNETVFTVDLAGSTDGSFVAEVAVAVPAAENLNGLLSLDSDENILLLGDSLLGKVWRIDLSTSIVTSPFSDDLMAVPVNSTFQPALGVDGLKLWTNTTSGQLYLYFTNVAQVSLARLPINADATEAAGPAELVATFTGTDNWDDFAVAQSSNTIFGAMNPNYIAKVDIETGAVDIVIDDADIGGGATAVVLKGDGSTGWTFSRSGAVFELELPAY